MSLWVDSFKRPVGKRVWDSTVESLRALRNLVNPLLLLDETTNDFRALVLEATQDAMDVELRKTPQQSNSDRLKRSECIMTSILQIVQHLRGSNKLKLMVTSQIQACVVTTRVCYEYYLAMENGQKRVLNGRKNNKDCALSLELANNGFEEKDARQICIELGATRREDLTFVMVGDVDKLTIKPPEKESLKELLKGIILPPNPPQEAQNIRQRQEAPPPPSGPRPGNLRPQPRANNVASMNAHLLAQMRACLQAMPL